MSNSLAALDRKIQSATKLQAVVSVMKSVAASNVVLLEQSVEASDGYFKTIEIGLSVGFRKLKEVALISDEKSYQQEKKRQAIVFGSDQGLVGKFNELISDYAVETLSNEGQPAQVTAIEARAQEHL